MAEERHTRHESPRFLALVAESGELPHLALGTSVGGTPKREWRYEGDDTYKVEVALVEK